MHAVNVLGQRLPPFLSLTGQRGYPAIHQLLPYEKYQTCFEYIDSTCVFVQQQNNSWSYVAYFEIKDSLQEFGFRIISPLPDLLSPGRGDRVTNAFENKPAGNHSGFTPVFQLRRLDIVKGAMQRTALKDMTPEAQKDRLYPVLRQTDQTNGLRIAPGMYQLIIFTANNSALAGSFALQFGSIPHIPMPVFFTSTDAIRN